MTTKAKPVLTMDNLYKTLEFMEALINKMEQAEGEGATRELREAVDILVDDVDDYLINK